MNITQGQVVGERAAVQTAVTMTVKLGLDVHAADVVVCLQEEGLLPKPSRRLRRADFLPWVRTLVRPGVRVHSCYEAGPCGYGLHRALTALGVSNLVVVPQRWDEQGQRVKTDKRDARELCDRLDRYLRGNAKVFAVVRVPTPEQEQRRALGRQRSGLVQDRQRCVVRGHGLMLAQGIQAEPGWWEPKHWPAWREQLPGWLQELLEPWQQQAVRLQEEIQRWTKRIEDLDPERPLLKGVGALTTTLIAMEVVDWTRFTNRRQVASYTGLCPSEQSSGTRRRQGAVTKHGNPRLRHQLVEAVWRLLQWQPDYPPIRKLRAAVGKRARKRAAVAAARRLAIDLWRIHTGQCPAEKLSLKLR